MHTSERLLNCLREDDTLTYLACPYSSRDDSVMAKRERRATQVANRFTKLGATVFSPLTQSVRQVQVDPSLGHSYEEWKEHDRTIISRCDYLVVLTLRGWSESEGVTDEIHCALDHNIPVLLAFWKGKGVVQLSLSKYSEQNDPLGELGEEAPGGEGAEEAEVTA